MNLVEQEGEAKSDYICELLLDLRRLLVLAAFERLADKHEVAEELVEFDQPLVDRLLAVRFNEHSAKHIHEGLH